MAALMMTSVVDMAIGQSSPARFEHLGLEDGLPSAYVTAVLQDHLGFLWFGTPDGLARYDGYGVRVFVHSDTDTASLADNRIFGLFEDSQHTLWVATGSGLCRFERGTDRFRRYAPASRTVEESDSNLVRWIAEDQSGNLWLSSSLMRTGIFRFDPRNGSFLHYPPAQGARRARLSTPRAFQDPPFVDSRGFVWVRELLGDGITRIDPRDGSARHFDPHGASTPGLLGPFMSSAYEDRIGRLWLDLGRAGIDRYDPVTEEFTHLPFPDGDRSYPRSVLSIARAITEDRLGRLYVLTNGALYQHDPDSDVLQHITTVEDQFVRFNGGLLQLVEDENGTLWTKAPTSGLISFDAQTRALQTHRHDPSSRLSLGRDELHAIHRDHQGILWIGTNGGGVSRYDPATAVVHTYRHHPDDPSTLSHSEVHALLADADHGVWIGSRGGLDYLDLRNGRIKRVTVRSSEDPGTEHSNIVSALHRGGNGIIWVGTRGIGLYRFESETGRFRRFQISVPGNQTVQALHGGRDALWVVIAGLLHRFDVDSETFTRYATNPALPSGLASTPGGDELVVSYHDTRNAHFLWFGYSRSGLYRANVLTGELTHFAHDATDESTLPPGTVNGIFRDTAGDLWVATSNGIGRFDASQGVFSRFLTEDCLPTRMCTAAVPTGDGRIWVVVGKRLMLFDPTDATTRPVRAEGMAMPVMTQMIMMSDGTLVAGGNDGLRVLPPDAPLVNAVGPPVVLTDFQIFNRSIEPGIGSVLPHALTHTNRITLAHDQNFFAFSFSALHHRNSPENEYSYMLEGVDPEWIAAGSRNFASYADVAPGKYRFRVTASNSDGIWNDVGTAVEVVISPPVWGTWWFRALALTALLVLAVATYQYRVRHLLQVERTRNRIARDLHDDIGSKVSSIGLMIDLGVRNGSLAPDEKHLLTEAAQIARQLVDDLRDTVWVIDAGRDTLSDLLARMQKVASQMLQGVAHQIEVPAPVPDVLLSMEWRRNALFIFKEALHNAVRHAGACSITVAFTVSEDCFGFEVVDDGFGFDEDRVGKGYGLQSIRARAEKLDGNLEILSATGKGTTVRLVARTV